MTELTLTGLVKRYGRVTALDGLSLEVETGEFYCLLGPSAAGKTTTLRAISGLEKLEAGRIEFAGRDITVGTRAGSRDRHDLPDLRALPAPHASARTWPIPLREARLAGGGDQAAGRRGGRAPADHPHAGAQDRPPPRAASSSGSRSAGRWCGGRSCCCSTSRLTNLDAKLRHDMRAEFKRLHRDLGTTMLYATPDQLEALTMGQRIAVMRAGRIVEVGTPAAALREARRRLRRAMVGAPAINLVPGTGRRAATAARMLELPFGEIGVRAQAMPPGRRRPRRCSPASGRTTSALGRRHRPGSRFRGAVHLTEPLGDITVLDLDAVAARS